MDKMLVAVFDGERQALAASRALKELGGEGVILVYAFAVIVKGLQNVSLADFAVDQYPVDSVLGTGTRSLVELLSQPSRAVDNLKPGATAGRVIAMANAGVDAGFVDDVLRLLVPGRAAIVCEIEEERVTPIDTMLASEGAIVFRCVRHGGVDIQIATDLDALLTEIHALENELFQTPQKAKNAVQVKLDLAKGRLQATKDRARRRADLVKREAEAKLVLLQERAAAAEGGTRARLERLANEVRVDYATRATRLNRAWQLPATSSRFVFRSPSSSDTRSQ